MIEIKHRWTGATLRTVDAENLRGANLSDADLRNAYLRNANLSDADLRNAHLSGANLRNANLSGADLRGADLRNANLRSAYLRNANLSDADLRNAHLSGANLRNANLSGADLRGADLSGADLSGADLRNANLSDADLNCLAAALGIEVDPTLPARIVAQIAAHPETHDQTTWHSACGMKHCVAGFATHLSGALGRYLDRQLGTATAATLLLWRPGCVMPSFAASATDEETIGRLKTMAAQAEAEASK